MKIEKKLVEIIKPENQLTLFGYESYFDFFMKLLKKNKIPNSILFSGEKGIGTRSCCCPTGRCPTAKAFGTYE